VDDKSPSACSKYLKIIKIEYNIHNQALKPYSSVIWEKVGGGLVGSGVLHLLDRYLPYLEERITPILFRTKNRTTFVVRFLIPVCLRYLTQSHTLIHCSRQSDKINIMFKTKILNKHTLTGHTSPLSPYKGVTHPSRGE